jgi:cytochrome o ubiquinol oxidase subunit II
MEFKVHAMPPQQFAAWVQSAKRQGQVLDERSYALLAQPSSYVKPMTYSNVAPRLFEAIVDGSAPAPQQLPHNRPAPGAGAGA